jgi:hypothetical protein
MRRIISSSVAFLVLPYISTFSHKWQDFRETVIEHEMGKVNMELQLDATITVFIDLLDQLNMFRANICPSSGAQCLPETC